MEYNRNQMEIITAFLLLCHMFLQGGAQVTLAQLQSTCGNDVALRCSFYGTFDPVSARIWKKGGEIIVNKGISTSSSKYREILSSGYFDLIITTFIASDEGIYHCIYGFDTASISVACSAPAQNAHEKESSGLSGGAIAGIVIAIIVVLAVIVFAILKGTGCISCECRKALQSFRNSI